MSSKRPITYRKISARRLQDIDLPRSKKPPIRAQKQSLNELLERESEFVKRLLDDADVRRSLASQTALARDPLLVWTDFDLSYWLTDLTKSDFVKWEDLSERMKATLGFHVGLSDGCCYSFNVNIHPDLEQKWLSQSISIPQIIQKRMKREIDREGISDLAYFYVLEARTKTGKSRTALHLHGYCLTENVIDTARLHKALERALRRDDVRRISRQRGVKIERSYDKPSKRYGRGTWVKYITENALRYDTRIKGRRVYMSRSLTRITKEFWGLLSENA